MSNFANNLDEVIKQHVERVLSQREMPDVPVDLIQTDSLGEVVEKLVILHIRMWMLEDAVAVAKTDSELADLKRKVDTCFKKKRPMFVEAVNRLIDLAITEDKSLVEDSVKIYHENKK